MHNRIIQLSVNPIEKDEYIVSDEFIGDVGEYSFVGDVADYTSDDCDRKEDVQNFCRQLKNRLGDLVDVNEEKETITFLEGAASKYFQPKKESLIKLLKELEADEINKLLTDGYFAYQIRNAVTTIYDTYIQVDGSLEVLDNFMRELEIGITYYIGGTVDYHC